MKKSDDFCLSRIRGMLKMSFNKRGDERLLSFWWFFILGLVLVAVAGGATMYYSTSIDVRNIEADVLADKLINCVIDNGHLNSELGNFNIFEKCRINNISNEYYGEMRVYASSSCKIENKELVCQNPEKIVNLNTNLNFEAYYSIQKKSRQNKLPQFAEKHVYTSDNKILWVVTASNHLSQEIWKN